MAKRTPNYELVAKRQGSLLFLVLGLLITNVAMFVLPPVVGPAAAGAAFMGVGILYWLCLLVGLVLVIRLMVAEGKHPVVIVLLSLLMFLPIINLLVLVHVNSEATLTLKAQGIKIGLLGAPKSEWAKLKPGHCRGCGYDRAGIELLGACPECGRIPEIR
ncbi:MAG: hypothetical protein IPJ41_02805 [Phycisphaerales bacterium]|nr:hypothetical protein [Phycisphaerales bacterium]